MCLGRIPWVGAIVNRTYAKYTTFPKQTGCVMLAMDPNDARHFIYSTVPAPSYQTFDGGASFEAILGGMCHVHLTPTRSRTRARTLTRTRALTLYQACSTSALIGRAGCTRPR